MAYGDPDWVRADDIPRSPLSHYKNFRGDHTTPPEEMSTDEVRGELYYLLSGYANAKNDNGHDIGLPPNLRARLHVLEQAVFGAMGDLRKLRSVQPC